MLTTFSIWKKVLQSAVDLWYNRVVTKVRNFFVYWGKDMLKFVLIFHAVFMLAMLIFAIIFRCLGKKSKFLFPGFKRLPKDLQDEVDFEKASIDASDECIGWLFYFLIAAALSSSSVIMSLILGLVYPIYLVRCFTCDPMLIFGSYIKIKPRTETEVKEWKLHYLSFASQ